MTIAEANRRVQAFLSDIDTIKSDIGSQLAVDAEDMNREQLSKGLRSDNEKIGEPFPHYFPDHKGHRQAAGLQTFFIDLKFTGYWYSTIFGTYDSDSNKIFIDSTDKERTNKLIFGGLSFDTICGCHINRPFGQEILGVNEDGQDALRDKGYLELLGKFKEYTGFE
jgi:hypothetical protein